MSRSDSLATGQQSLIDPTVTYPLTPIRTAGCPETSTDDQQVPVEVTYDYDAVDDRLFEGSIGSGLERWQPLLPPMQANSLGAGGTPLVEVSSLADWSGVDGPVYFKDESRNPTWSHKDRLNRLTVGAAMQVGAKGIVGSSSGNHGASAAAYASRSDLPAVFVTMPDTPEAMQGFMRAYDVALLRIEGWENRMDVVDRLADKGYHPVTSRTATHTGHPFGTEGCKTIAYEILVELGAVPGAVFVPTSQAELLYGVWKGFRELRELGLTDETPRMVACEPEHRSPLSAARRRDEPIVDIDPGRSVAHSIGGTRSTHRGYMALEQSGGQALPVPDDLLMKARDQAAAAGFWQELSGAAGLAGLKKTTLELDGPTVVLGTSSGLKHGTTFTAPRVDPQSDSVEAILRDRYDIQIV